MFKILYLYIYNYIYIYIGVKVPGAEYTFERDRVDGADPRKKFGPNLSKKSKSDKLE